MARNPAEQTSKSEVTIEPALKGGASGDTGLVKGESAASAVEGENGVLADGADQSADDRVRARAYELWQAAGSPEYEADRFWHEAVRQIQGSS